MTSIQLKELGFNSWQPIPQNNIACRNLILRLPRTNGVYVLKANSEVLRLKGTSDLIYIGHGKIQTRLQNLLISFLPEKFKNYSTRHSASRELTRILRETGMCLELSYLEKETKEESRSIESSLIRGYCLDHIEPPPLNNTRR